MPGDEQKKKSKTMHAWLAITAIIVSTDVSHELRRGEGQIRYQSVSLVLAIVKNCLKRLSEAHTTQTKPWPTQLPTSDNNSPITKRIKTNETQNVSLTLATVEDCRRKQGDGTVGTRAVVS